MSNDDTETWRAAFERATRGSGTNLQAWWDKYLQVRAYYFEHGNSYAGINKELKFWSQWSGTVRRAKNNGTLSGEQLHYLRQIEFPYQGIKNTGVPPNPDSEIAAALRLHKKFTSEAGLSTREKRDYQNLMADMRTRYKSGHLGDSTAKKLDLS